NESSDSDPQFTLFFGTVSLRDENLLALKQYTAMIDIKTLPSNLPFEKYLAPQVIEYSSFAFVDPPTYARAPGFVFDLSVILEDKNKQLSLNVADTANHKTLIQNLKELSRLDDSQ
ncbi:44923_t:CDS:2, partial [Gigaspora margarita]